MLFIQNFKNKGFSAMKILDYYEALSEIRLALGNYIFGGRVCGEVTRVEVPVSVLRCYPVNYGLMSCGQKKEKVVIEFSNETKPEIWLVGENDGDGEDLDYLEFLSICVLLGEMEKVKETCVELRKIFFENTKEVENGSGIEN